MKKHPCPTISEIAYKNAKAGGHYFDRDTLRFFGQRRSDFRRKRLADGRIVVYAYAHRRWNIGFAGMPSSLAVFDETTGDISTPDDAKELKAALTR